MIDEQDLGNNGQDHELELDTVEVHPDQLPLPGLPNPSAEPDQLSLI